MNIRQYLLYKQAAGNDEIMLPEGTNQFSDAEPIDDPAINNDEINVQDNGYDTVGPIDQDPSTTTSTVASSMANDNSLAAAIDKAYGGRKARQIREDNSYFNSADFRNAQGSTVGGKGDWMGHFNKDTGTYDVMDKNTNWMLSDDQRNKWRNYEYNRINSIWGNMSEEEQNKYRDKYNARRNALGYDEAGNDMYKTEVGALSSPVSQPNDNQNDNFTVGDNVSEPMSTSTSTEQTEINQAPDSQPPVNQPQRPSYQAMQQNKQELQAWDDHYNAIKQNIMTPSQVQRWAARGFSREQMEAYADREARKQATNRYGNRPNDIMEEYNYNMNAQASPQQQFGYQPMNREQMMTAQNKPPASSQERLREGNPIYDREVSRLNNQIVKLQQRIQSGAGPFDKARNRDLARRELAMVQKTLDGIKSQGLAPDGSFKGVQRIGKRSLQ